MRARIVAAVAAVVTAGAAIGVAGAASRASTDHGNGRQSRTSGVAVGGASVFVWSTHRSSDDGGGCTLSFSVASAAQHPSRGALTAGHCVETLAGGPSYAVHQTRNIRTDVTDPGVQLGAVAAGRYRLGRDGDSAFISLDPGRRARPAVFVGGTRSARTIPVAGLLAPRRGMSVCYSGAASGEHCGFTVVAGPKRVSFPDHGTTYRISHEWAATRRTCTSRAGDSGSPVYVERHGAAYAVGILSGGQKHAGQCPFFFTPVRVALHQFGLKLLIAS